MSESNWDFKKIFLAGVGAAAISIEKSRELVDECVKKGELTVQQGKVLNEELRHEVKEAVRSAVKVEVVEEKPEEDLLGRVQKMTPEERAALKAKLAELEQE